MADTVIIAQEVHLAGPEPVTAKVNKGMIFKSSSKIIPVPHFH